MSAKEGDVVDSVISPSQASFPSPATFIPHDFCDMMIALQLATTNYGSHNNSNRPKATRPGGGYLLPTVPYRTIPTLYPTMSLVIEICFSPFPFFFSLSRAPCPSFRPSFLAPFVCEYRASYMCVLN